MPIQFRLLIRFFYLHVFQATLIHATVNVHHLTTFRHRLTAGSMFSVSRFDVTECNQNFMLSDSPLAIRFSDSTAMDEMTEPVNPIPEERFRFCNHSELLGLANTNTHLPDITGEICAIHILFSPWQYVYVTLSLFDSQSVAFRNKIERKEWFPEADKLEELKMKQPIQLMVLEELRITNYRVIVEGDLIMIVEVRSRRSKNFALEK
ncbi:hypothetical protein HID58_087225 [Brassica napus]|uniref:Uncharacterized protein n=1 Tax=Brassica napus TaxID=3708 RepID=A0ABQ7XSN7_BRANA|nr:hypothetical protein HID58_087225 [Brassica napus]